MGGTTTSEDFATGDSRSNMIALHHSINQIYGAAAAIPLEENPAN